MSLLPDTIKELAMLGANIEITDSKLLPDTLKDLVRIAASREGHVTIDAKGLLPATLKEIAIIGRKHVTFRV